MPNENLQPVWTHLVRMSPEWYLDNGVLIHRDAVLETDVGNGTGALKRLVVQYIYASQNRSRSVKREMRRVLDEFRPDHWGLNFGAGATRFHDRILNLDIGREPATDVVMAGRQLPFRENVFDLVISQEVLEHVDDPWHWIGELHRVLKPGGRFFCQVPFIIGYHPGPTDYWRFTREAFGQLFPSDVWDIEKLELALGHGSALYRILVEFFAVTASTIHHRLYLPAKAASAILCAPVQLFDHVTRFSNQQHRIPGGYFCTVRKRPV